MATVRYTVLDGAILAQTRDGVKHNYVPDPLGSVVALYDMNQTKTDTFSYWPYGEEKARTGTTETPFKFGGTVGYYSDSGDRIYVRARYLSRTMGRWMTEDPIWSDSQDANLFRYVRNAPGNWLDPSGLAVPIIVAVCAAACVGCAVCAYSECNKCGRDVGCWISCIETQFQDSFADWRAVDASFAS